MLYDIYAMDFKFENCASEKEEIKTVTPYAVLHFVLSGEGYLNGKKITENCVFIAFENTAMQYAPSRTKPWSYIYLRLKGEAIKEAFLHYGFDLEQITVLPFHKQEILFKILALYQAFENTNDIDARTAIANTVLLLFKDNERLTGNKSRQLQHVERIRRYIEEHFDRHLTIESVASKFFLNKNYVRTLFAKYLGTSPKAYLQNIRMIRAKLLLSSTDKDITLIASAVGYKDSLLFSKTFKRYFQVSPKQYRETHRI